MPSHSNVSCLYLVLWVLCTVLPNCLNSRQPVCTTPGQLSCDADCRNLVLCLGDVDDDTALVEVVVEACHPDSPSAPTFCSITQARCTSDHNSCRGSTFDFQCTSLGLFPDPFSCHFYYICSTDPIDGVVKPTRYPCDPEDKGFSTKKGLCDLEPESIVCKVNQVPWCRAVGQSGLTLENANYYYVCKRNDDVLYPVVYQCPRGWLFDDVTKRCEAN